MRQPKHTVLIYCGANRTEPDYFEGLRELLRAANVTMTVRAEGVDPVRLINRAAEFRERRRDVFDEVWCVVDTDEFDIPAAVVASRRHNVNLAVSNPCFELWLLLHHTDCTAYCQGYADVLTRLRRHVPGYDKAAMDFRAFAAGIEAAIERAEKLDSSGTDHERNPSRGVWVLVKRLMGFMR
jgi:hypothetical protein